MKVLEIIYSLSSGGAERFVVDLSNELAELKNSVVLCTLLDDSKKNNGFYKPEISAKVMYQNLRLKEGFRILDIYYLWKLINDTKPDIVHCHLAVVFYLLPLSVIFPKMKFFHTIHNDAPREVSSKLQYYLRRFFYSYGIIQSITISNETTQSFIKYYKSQRYCQIYNGRKQPAPSSEFENVKGFIDTIRTKSKTIFLHVGRYAEQKNQHMLIKVFNQIIKEGKSVALLIIGDGFEKPKGVELKAMASDMIYFLGLKQNVVDFYLNSDAFCLSSFHEGMPITLIEAFACGCIPVCTPVGGISDSIQNGITGYLSKSVSEEDYYNAVMSYINNKDKINKEHLVEYYKSKFGIRECATQHLKLFNSKNTRKKL
ncbi:MAG: hypothetical protein FD181_2476 [Prolixibacteraceae bacterium]|nr:MAG: hypothetical protein FD181_2476 [Prolixibacteraceae bacterium]